MVGEPPQRLHPSRGSAASSRRSIARGRVPGPSAWSQRASCRWRRGARRDCRRPGDDEHSLARDSGRRRRALRHDEPADAPDRGQGSRDDLRDGPPACTRTTSLTGGAGRRRPLGPGRSAAPPSRARRRTWRTAWSLRWAPSPPSRCSRGRSTRSVEFRPRIRRGRLGESGEYARLDAGLPVEARRLGAGPTRRRRDVAARPRESSLSSPSRADDRAPFQPHARGSMGFPRRTPGGRWASWPRPPVSDSEKPGAYVLNPDSPLPTTETSRSAIRDRRRRRRADLPARRRNARADGGIAWS